MKAVIAVLVLFAVGPTMGLTAAETVYDIKLGFEEAKLPTGWRVGGGAEYTYKRDTNIKRSGQASASVTVKDGVAKYGFPHMAYRLSDLNIPEGESYRWELSFHCKTQMTPWQKGTGFLCAVVQYLDAQNKRLKSVEGARADGATDWHDLRLSGTVDSKVKGLSVLLISRGPGKAWVDDIRFTIRAPGELRLAGVFSDNAVLQRGVPVPVWGWAKPDADITVRLAGQKKSTKTDGQGTWRVVLDPMKADTTPRTLLVSSSDPKEELRVSNLLVGDVWLCSGQSNMALTMGYCVRSYPALKRRLEQANNPLLRLGTVPFTVNSEPQANVDCAWRAADAGSAQGFSAIGYLFGEQIQRQVGVPIGIINSSRGGSYIEQWLPAGQAKNLPACAPFVKRHQKALAEYPKAKAQYEKALASFKKKSPAGEKPPKAPRDPNARAPSQLFNGMIAPLVSYPLKGVLWYQGEGNVWQFSSYDTMMVGLIRSWRGLWKQPELPFFMTELAPYNKHKPEPHDSPRCRFGVTLAKAARDAGNAWTITITDGGEQKDIHPRYKDIPAERFAAMALANVYGKDIVHKGPVLKSWKVEGGKAVLTFDSVGKGLETRAVTLDGRKLPADKLVGFELADKNRRFFRATAKVTGANTVVVSHPEVPEPVTVRYAWANFPLCNLYNSAGFAAYPFRTDDWPWMTPGK